MRRLGSAGCNTKRELMPGWTTVATLPLYELKASPFSDGIAWRPAYDRRVYGKASTNNERS